MEQKEHNDNNIQMEEDKAKKERESNEETLEKINSYLIMLETEMEKVADTNTEREDIKDEEIILDVTREFESLFGTGYENKPLSFSLGLNIHESLNNLPTLLWKNLRIVHRRDDDKKFLSVKFLIRLLNYFIYFYTKHKLEENNAIIHLICGLLITANIKLETSRKAQTFFSYFDNALLTVCQIKMNKEFLHNQSMYDATLTQFSMLARSQKIKQIEEYKKVYEKYISYISLKEDEKQKGFKDFSATLFNLDMRVQNFDEFYRSRFRKDPTEFRKLFSKVWHSQLFTECFRKLNESVEKIKIIQQNQKKPEFQNINFETYDVKCIEKIIQNFDTIYKFVNLPESIGGLMVFFEILIRNMDTNDELKWNMEVAEAFLLILMVHETIHLMLRIDVSEKDIFNLHSPRSALEDLQDGGRNFLAILFGKELNSLSLRQAKMLLEMKTWNTPCELTIHDKTIEEGAEKTNEDINVNLIIEDKTTGKTKEQIADEKVKEIEEKAQDPLTKFQLRFNDSGSEKKFDAGFLAGKIYPILSCLFDSKR